MYFPIIKETHSSLEKNSVVAIQKYITNLTRQNTRELSVLGSLDTSIMFVEFVPRVVLVEEDTLLQIDSCRALLLDKLKQINLDVNKIYATSIIKKFPELLQPTLQEKTLFNSEILIQQPQVIICMGEEPIKFLFPKADYSQMLLYPRSLRITATKDATIFAVPHPIDCLENSEFATQFQATLHTVAKFLHDEEVNNLTFATKAPTKIVEIIEPLLRKKQFSIKEIPLHEDHCALF